MSTSLVITVIGPDRPGIVRMLADRGRAFDANWAESRMASLAGQLAGIIGWEVPAGKAEAMGAAVRELESDADCQWPRSDHRQRSIEKTTAVAEPIARIIES